MEGPLLRGALGVIRGAFRSGAGGLPSAERGKFATPLAKAGEEVKEFLVGGLWFIGCSFSGHGGLAG
jgi:hypothetical protein